LEIKVGQIVWTKSGPYSRKGRVHEITDKYVSIELFHAGSGPRYFVQISPDGKVPDPEWGGPFGHFEYIGPTVGMVQVDPCYPRIEFGPLELTADPACSDDPRQTEVPQR
jgi:hypothetical protein